MNLALYVAETELQPSPQWVTGMMLVYFPNTSVALTYYTLTHCSGPFALQLFLVSW